MNIIVIIYNSLIRLPIVKHLAEGGNNTIAATDGGSALEMLAESKVDCIILDLNMPAIVNGIELLKQIKKDYPDIKMIIINSNFDENVIAILGKVGIKHVISTPVDMEKLSNMVNPVLE